MADIRKTFNFRDGVQVDDEVLVVRGNRVGLGTTSPDQLLDVRGNANITGVTSTVNFNATGVGTFGGVSLGSTINMDSTSGVITAVAFKGDGSTLSNLPTSQWTDVNVGAGVSPIYVEGNVGIGTTDPANPLQIGGNPNNGIGVGFSTSGNIKATGIITATTFSGSLIGNVTGDLTGTASTATLANTATVAVNAQGLTGSPSVTVSNINVTGVGTVASLEATSLTTPVFTGHNSIRAPHGTSTTIVVTVAAKTAAHRYNGSGSSNGFKLDGVEAPFLTLTPGRTYIFDVSDGTNSGQPFRFYYDVDKTTEYTTGVTASGTAGITGATVTLVVTDTTPTVLHYQSVSSVKMGNAIQTNSNILDTEHNSTIRGTLTATTVIGNLTGTATTANNLSNGANITTGTISNDRLPNPVTKNLTGNVTGNINSTGVSTTTRLFTDDLSISGVSTHTGASIFNGNIDSNAEAEFAYINVGVGTITNARTTTLDVVGVSTFGGAVDINNGVNIQNNLVVGGDVDVDGHTELDMLNVSGIVTSTSFIGPLTGNVTGDATGLSGSPNITVTNFKASGLSTVTTLISDSIGIGTITANANLHIFDSSSTSQIYVGKQNSTTSDGAVFKYGGGSQLYSQSDSLDILNHGDGNFNFFLHGNSASYLWHKGNNSPLMSLTQNGRLGIGVTSPTDKLMVSGNAHFTGVVTATQFIPVNDIVGNLVGNVIGNVDGNINSTGISTLGQILIPQDQTAGIGIGVTPSGNSITVGNTATNRFFVGAGASESGAVGIRISDFSNIAGSSPSLEVNGAVFLHGGTLQVGGAPNPGSATTLPPRAQLDFSEVINTLPTNPMANIAYMILPRLTTGERNSLRDGRTTGTTLLSGSIIYNTTNNRMEVWMGSSWAGIATVA